ncbi:MAG TPA: hypothetical protein VGK33_18680, partial [Chloroflexota bacterium]
MTPQAATVEHARSRFARLSWVGQWLPALGVLIPCVLAASLALQRLGFASLWLDEAWVGDVVLNGDFSPHALNSTPLGFALVVRAAATAVGPTEAGLRLPASALFIVATLLMVFLARQLRLPYPAAILAATLLATNLAALTYARMLKPYTADIFFAIVLPLLAEQVRRQPSPRRWARYGVALALAPFLSFVSLFVGACTATVLGWSTLRSPAAARRSWLTVHVVAAAVILAYLLAFARLQRSDLVDYWTAADGFPLEHDILQLLGWYTAQGWGLLQYLFSPVAGLALVLILIGVAGLARQAPAGLFMLAGPLVLAAVSSLAAGYPFNTTTGGRLLLFSLPGLLMLAVCGADQLRLLGRARLGGAALAAVALTVLCLPSLGGIYWALADPLPAISGTSVEETRGLIVDKLLPNLKDGDVVYVENSARPAFGYYAPAFRQVAVGGQFESMDDGNVTIVLGGAYDVSSTSAQSDAAELSSAISGKTGGRLWLLHAHTGPTA